MKEIIKMRTEITWKERNNRENQGNLKLVLGEKINKTDEHPAKLEKYDPIQQNEK